MAEIYDHQKIKVCFVHIDFGVNLNWECSIIIRFSSPVCKNLRSWFHLVTGKFLEDMFQFRPTI